MVDTKRSREYAPRSGKHPRDPARPASAAGETTDKRGAPPGERELGAEAEDRYSERSNDASTSSSSGGPTGEASSGDPSSAPSKRAIPAGAKGPETEERTKQRYSRSAS